MNLKSCLPKTLILLLFFLFCFVIVGHFMRDSILEGMENNSNNESDDDENSDDDDNNLSSQNSGEIQFLKSSMKELQEKVKENQQDIAKLNHVLEQVKKNTKAIHHNSKAIMKATTSQLSNKK